MYVIGAGDCGQLGVGEDDVEALRARLSPVASGAEARPLFLHHKYQLAKLCSSLHRAKLRCRQIDYEG